MEVMIEGGRQKVSVQIHPKREGLSPQETKMDFQIQVPRQATVRIDCESETGSPWKMLTATCRRGRQRARGVVRDPGEILRSARWTAPYSSAIPPVKSRPVPSAGILEFVEVNGSRLVGNSNSGTIRYEGDFGSGGNYILNNHSSWIRIQPSRQASLI